MIGSTKKENCLGVVIKGIGKSEEFSDEASMPSIFMFDPYLEVGSCDWDCLEETLLSPYGWEVSLQYCAAGYRGWYRRLALHSANAICGRARHEL